MDLRTRRSFITGFISSFLGIGVFAWIKTQKQNNGIPWVLRMVLDGNAWLWEKLPSTQSHELPASRIPKPGTPPRVNGRIGIPKASNDSQAKHDLSQWNIDIYEQVGLQERHLKTFSIAELKNLPRTQTSTEFYCIEGWSTAFSYEGIRFSDFLKAVGLSSDYAYVGLRTPDNQYYVSIDMKSMLHPQTLLADHMNAVPLSMENGAPLRLLIPIKYGIKNLKRIGSIHFSNSRPPDYWAERGYDWYAGL